MRKGNIILSFLVSVLLVFFTYAYTDAFQAEVIPSEINPGGAFAIKVSGSGTSIVPVAVLNKRQINFSACGQSCFIAVGAVDLETDPGVYKVQLSIGKERMDIRLVVKYTSFPTVSLTLPENKVSLSPEDLSRAQREAERLRLIWRTSTVKLWKGSFILPLENDSSTAFGTKRTINQNRISIHKGMDIKGKKGEEVKASNRGRVVLAEEFFFGGNTVIIDHGQEIFTIYMHLSVFNVRFGDIVSKGDIIAFVGSTGRASGPHLHFGVKVLEINTDPISLVRLEL